MKVEVYFNLHKKLWSIRKPHGRIIGHSCYCKLHSVEFVVQPAGRDRVIREGRKNVHAFVRGVLVTDEQTKNPKRWLPITYNPYKFDHFYNKNTLKPIYDAQEVWMYGTEGNINVYAKP